MPTVRLTKKLKAAIKNAAAEIPAKIRNEQPELETKTQSTFLNHVRKQFGLDPHDVKPLNSRITRLQIINYPFDEHKYLFTFPVPPTNLFIPAPLSYSVDKLTIDMDIIHNDYLQIPDKIIAELDRVITQRVDIEQQATAFTNTLEELLDKCTTIKQFIEAWPQGEQFIPSTDLQKHYEQEQKLRKRGVYLEDEQLSALNTTLLTSKII